MRPTKRVSGEATIVLGGGIVLLIITIVTSWWVLLVFGGVALGAGTIMAMVDWLDGISRSDPRRGH